MQRISSLFLSLYLVCFVIVPPSFADDLPCAAQLFQGTEPKLENVKLQLKTQELCYSQLTLLYSAMARTPLWSAEHLTAERIMIARQLPRPRSNVFHSEQNLPAGDRSELADYRNSGYDRGHMSPNGDMSTPDAQEESFSLANMVPQDPCNNEVLWEGIESAVRDLTLSSGETYVVTGPAFIGDTIQSLKDRVLVPTHVFKAVYVPSQNAAGVYFAPNDPSQAWEAISVKDLATRIGIDVFPSVADSIKAGMMQLPRPTPHFGCRVHMSEAGRPRDTKGQQ